MLSVLARIQAIVLPRLYKCDITRMLSPPQRFNWAFVVESTLQGDCRRKRREIRQALRLHSLRSAEPLWKKQTRMIWFGRNVKCKTRFITCFIYSLSIYILIMPSIYALISHQPPPPPSNIYTSPIPTNLYLCMSSQSY